MADCELCGAMRVSTRAVIMGKAQIQACKRCVDKMGLVEHKVAPGLSNINTSRNSTSGGYGGIGRKGKDIMLKREKVLHSNFDKIVTRAREERDRIINLAQAYQESEIPKAIGEAAKITESANAFKQRRIARAEGEAQGFIKLLEAYEKSPDVTRQRLYLEMVERVFPNFNKYIINDSKILPLLDIEPN